MAETLISPGVLAKEIDTSFVPRLPIQAGAAIMGPTVKGPLIPTLVTSWADYQNKFGTTLISSSNIYTYFTSISAYNYFSNGGTSLLVARIVSGTYTPASSSITNNTALVPGTISTGALALAPGLINPINQYFQVYDEGGGANDQGYWYFFPTSSGNYPDNIYDKTYFFASGSTFGDTFTNFINKLNYVHNTADITLEVTGSIVTSSAGALPVTMSFSASIEGVAFNTFKIYYTSSIVGGNVSTVTLGGGSDSTGGTAFVLKTIAVGADQNSSSSLDAAGVLASGSSDNIRWQIANRNTGSGTFSLIIRRGDDSTNNQNILESFDNLSLDPFSPNYITKIVGDITQNIKDDDGYYLQTSGSYAGGSRYVRVYSVANTPNYFDSNGAITNNSFKNYIPLNGSGSFSGGLGTIKGGSNFYENVNSSNTQGLIAGNYTTITNLLANKDLYKFNIVTTPGLTPSIAPAVINNVITLAQDRGDCIYITDLASYGSTTAAIIANAAAKNSSYAATYWPWCQVADPSTGQIVWVPASTLIPGVYAYNDKVAEPWFAPAGINRGGLSTVVRTERNLPQATRDSLYNGKVNPIATFPGTGVVVYGQKTLQTRASALDRVNVRRLLIALKSYITQVADNLVFEQNTVATRNNFLGQVNPYLESVQQRQGLYAFKVIMNDSNNTADVIDRNQLVGQIYIQPTKTAEFIYLDFIVTPTGATFPG